VALIFITGGFWFPPLWSFVHDQPFPDEWVDLTILYELMIGHAVLIWFICFRPGRKKKWSELF
jgi:hypothetical protein